MPAAPRSFESPAGTVMVFPDAATAYRDAADRMAAAITERDGRAVLGLATGNTPVPFYRRLVQLHTAGTLSFQDVRTFNLDEYYPIHPLDPASYRSYMHRHLFGHIDIPPNQAHLLDGTVPEAFVAAHCADFDRWIEDAGGLDVQLLGIGRDGHIGFNEPTDLPVAEFLKLPTRLAELHPWTLADAARDFGGDPDLVPRRALTVGVAPILAARSILMLAFGAEKAAIVAQAISGPVTGQVPASVLQTVRDKVTWMLDEAAALEIG
jgi:glucosamine-6-phosphate deaminase